MRINFAARYKEVDNLLKASTKPLAESKDVAFEQDLGVLLLQDPEITVKSGEKQGIKSEPYLPLQSLKDPLEDIKASFRFPEPELQMTPLDPQKPRLEVSEQLTPSATPVKTPTVLDVRRVEVPAKMDLTGVPQLSKQEIQGRLISAAQKLGLDPALTQSVVNAESSFNVRAVSRDGHASKGLFQLLDSTGRHLLSKTDEVANSRKYDPFNPDLNIKLGTNYLRYLHDIFSTQTTLPNNLKTTPAADAASLEKLALAAFNAGEGRVASAQGRSEALGKDPAYYDQVAPHLPRSTREYVKRVTDGKRSY